MTELNADTPIQYLRGVGPVRAGQFAKLGLRTVGELLEYFPFRHERDQGCVDIADLEPDTTATVRGTVTRLSGRHSSQTATIDDGTGKCRLRWFQRPFSRDALYVTATVLATGKVKLYNDSLELVQPSVRVFPADHLPVVHDNQARLAGVYRGSPDLRSAVIRRAVDEVLKCERLPVVDFVPARLLANHDLPARADAVRAMHAPRDDGEVARARRRLAYEEFLLLELAMALRRRRLVALHAGHRLVCAPEIDRRIRARFPFELTPSQNEVVREIAGDMGSGRPMTRLLQGDVGSGKTVVALYACLLAIAHGAQAAIMAPTELLAGQHFANIEKYLAGSRVRRALLRGGLPREERARLLGRIQTGETDLAVGTQALIQQDVAFRELALVIVDEQHKFGVIQRAAFRTKGPTPHYLVMTATPIPRTLAMTVFGDLDVSVIKQPPPGRGRIVTKVVTPNQWETVMAYVRGRLEAGEQAYVVCPRIGGQANAPDTVESDEQSAAATSAGSAPAPRPDARRELISVQATLERLARGPWSGLNLGLLHGGLSAREKDLILNAFAGGELHAIVSTTVVEVGVDVPNATIMIIEHAERFGLSQLHQLRGRVGRGERDSLCVLMAHGPAAARAGTAGGGPAAERLSVLARTTDGFRIAEADLKHRGPGELFGTRQHGLPELRFGSLVEDFGLLESARADAFAIIRADPELARPEHGELYTALRRFLGGRLALIDAG